MIPGDEHMAARLGLMGLGLRPAQASPLPERVLWTGGMQGSGVRRRGGGEGETG